MSTGLLTRKNMKAKMTAVALHYRLWLKLGSLLVVLAIVGFGTSLLVAHDMAPDVVFVKLNGEKLALKDLRGKVVVVNFWATSCTTCIGEMPQMAATYNKYKNQGLDFVAVAMSYDPPNYVLHYAATRKLPFKVVLDPQETLAKAFGGVKLTPTTFVIGKDGRIFKRYVGAPQFAQLQQLLEQLLAA